MGSGGSKSKAKGKAKREEKHQSPPPAAAAVSTEDNPTSKAEQGGSVCAAGPTSSTTIAKPDPASLDKQDQPAMEKEGEYVEAVVAKASEFGENE